MSWAGGEAVVLRMAERRDAASLRRVAERDCAAVPGGPLLVAEVGGELVAARSLSDRTAISDPFRRTAEIVELLALRADQLPTASNGGRRPGKLKEWPKATRSTAPLPV